MADLTREQQYGLELAKIKARSGTLRIALVGAFILIGMGIAGYVLVQIKSENVWSVIATIASVAIPAAAGTCFVYRMNAKFKLYIKNHAGHVSEVEASLDGSRSSSESNCDGTHEYDNK